MHAASEAAREAAAEAARRAEQAAAHAAAEQAARQAEEAAKTSTRMEPKRVVGRVVRRSVSFAAAAPRAAVRTLRESVKFLTARKPAATADDLSKALADPTGPLRSGRPPEPFQVELPVPLRTQERNACGTTSLAMIAQYFGRNVTPQEIDRTSRSFGLFTSPDNLLSWARNNGFRAEMKNDASIDDLTRMIDQGVPPMCLVDSGSRTDIQLHYVVVSGYDRGPDGEVSRLRLSDPMGRLREVTPEQFLREWDDIPFVGVRTGERRLMMTFVPEGNRPITAPDGTVRPASSIELPKSSLGADLRNMPVRNLQDGVSDVLNGIRRGRVGDVVGGAFEAVAGLPAFLVSKIPIPGFHELGGAMAKVADFVAEPIKALGSLVTSVGRRIGGFLRRLF